MGEVLQKASESLAVIDLKNDYPELAKALLNGKMTRDEAVAMAILKRAVADLTENVPKLWEATTSLARHHPRKFEATATDLDHVLVALEPFKATST